MSNLKGEEQETGELCCKDTVTHMITPDIAQFQKSTKRKPENQTLSFWFV
jgi:hypothetical protein